MIKMKENKIIVTYEDVISTYKIRKNGEKALSAYMHWFPIKSSIKLAGIIADLMGDGHLQDHPHWRLDYTSNSMEELERFNQEVYSLFGVQGKIRDCTTNQYGTMNLGINPKQLGRVLKLAGVPTGAKVLQEFSIPKWILGDLELQDSTYWEKIHIRNVHSDIHKAQNNEKLNNLHSQFHFHFQILNNRNI